MTLWIGVKKMGFDWVSVSGGDKKPFTDGPWEEADAVLSERDTLRATLSRVEAERDALRIGSCVWSPSDPEDVDRLWSTTCKREFVFLDGGPVENEIKFCPFCGGLVEIDALTTTEGEKP